MLSTGGLSRRVKLLNYGEKEAVFVWRELFVYTYNVIITSFFTRAVELIR